MCSRFGHLFKRLNSIYKLWRSAVICCSLVFYPNGISSAIQKCKWVYFLNLGIWSRVANPFPRRLIFQPTVYGQCTHHSWVGIADGAEISKRISVMAWIWSSTLTTPPLLYNGLCQSKVFIKRRATLIVSSSFSHLKSCLFSRALEFFWKAHAVRSAL